MKNKDIPYCTWFLRVHILHYNSI